MAKKLYGTDPDQVPTNANLGTMAYQDKDNLAVGEVHSDNQTIVSTKSTNAFSVTTNTGSNVALSIGGSSTINGVTSGTQAFYIMNVARDSGSGKSTYFNGNIGFPNGYGIDFSASQGGGASSSVLDDYEEGTWTITDGSGAGLSFTVQDNVYTKVGRLVVASAIITWPSTSNTSAARIVLPFTSIPNNSHSGGVVTEQNWNTATTLTASCNYTDGVVFRQRGGSSLDNADLSGKKLRFTVTYHAT